MVFCIVALVVFGFLGIFSAKYRAYFKESLHCMKRTAMLKPCDTEFDRKLKAKITASLLKKSEKLGSFVYKRFSIIAWILLVTMIVSAVFSAISIYNLAAYGNCNGPESTDICGLNPEGTSGVGSQDQLNPTLVAYEGYEKGSGNITVVEFGCYLCPYTKKAESIVNELLTKYQGKVKFIYKDFPVERHMLSTKAAVAAKCVYRQSQESYWIYHQRLFDNQKDISEQRMLNLAEDLAINYTMFENCFDKNETKLDVENDYENGKLVGVYGTPTFFIGNITIIGPKTLSEFEKAIKGQEVINEEINSCTDQ